MAAFDLNSLYFLKNAAPQTTSFEEAYAPVEKGFNLGRAYNENYNKNSLQNLIAQREKEGIPFDRLSNEAAKWDLGVAANIMRPERRKSIEFNYKLDVEKFNQWRKDMARRICGLILQKADQLRIPQEQLDEVLNIAASYVVTYDEALAQWLLGQAGTRRAAQGRLNRQNNKPIKDDENNITNTMEENAKPIGDAESDPVARAFRGKLAACARRLLQWKQVNPYDHMNNPDGRLIYDRMLSALLTVKNPMALTDEEVTELLKGNYEENPQVKKYMRGKNDIPAGDDGMYGLKPIHKKSWSGSGADVIDSVNLAKLSNFANDLKVDDPEFLEKLKAARNVITEGAVIKDNDMKQQSINPIQDILNKKEAEYNKQVDELKSLGVKNPEDAFRKFKSLFGQRASIGTVLQFRNFNSFVNSYISKAPMTAISNGLLVGTPNYKPTVEEFKTAKSIHGSLNDNMRNYIRRMGVPIASVIADAESEYPALWALASDVQKQIRAIWSSVSSDLSGEEYAQLKKLYTDLFHIDKNAWDIIEGRKDFPMNEEYDRQLKKMQDSQKKNSKPADLSVTETGNEPSGTVSAAEWLRRRREGK